MIIFEIHIYVEVKKNSIVTILLTSLDSFNGANYLEMDIKNCKLILRQDVHFLPNERKILNASMNSFVETES